MIRIIAEEPTWNGIYKDSGADQYYSNLRSQQQKMFLQLLIHSFKPK